MTSGSSSSGSLFTTVITLPGNSITTIIAPSEIDSPWPTWDLPPEPTITGQPDKEVGDLALLLFALRNRRSLIWTNRKDEFVENVKDTSNDLVGFLSKIPNPPQPDPACSNSKKKRDFAYSANNLYRRGILDGVIDTLKDVTQSIACAAKVASNLAVKVNLPDPPPNEIENLTDALEKLGKKIEEQENDPSKTSDTPSSTQSSSSTSSCSASAASSCGTSCVAGSTSSCTTTCTTFTGCSVTNTASATTSTASGKETPPPFGIIEAHIDTFWYMEDVETSDEDDEKLYSSMRSFMNDGSDGTSTEDPTPSQTAEPSQTPDPGKPELTDNCADTTVYAAFDYATANSDIKNFCKDGVELMIPAMPIWDTFDHSDKNFKLQLAVQWASEGQDGCNRPEGNLWTTISQQDCEKQFMNAMNRCNTENDLSHKYGNYPMIWNGPQGCIDIWLVGHGTDWSCDDLGSKSHECTGKKKGS